MVGIHAGILAMLLGIAVLGGLAALVALGIYFLARPQQPMPSYAQPAPSAPSRETPLEILARRFASGEISAEEYQRARDLLPGGNPGA